jgi:hypothetical protein
MRDQEKTYYGFRKEGSKKASASGSRSATLLGPDPESGMCKNQDPGKTSRIHNTETNDPYPSPLNKKFVLTVLHYVCCGVRPFGVVCHLVRGSWRVLKWKKTVIPVLQIRDPGSGVFLTLQAARRWWRRVCFLYLRLEGPICSCTGSKKGVKASMCPITEAGGAYMEQYSQPEGGGGGERGGQYVSYSRGFRYKIHTFLHPLLPPPLFWMPVQCTAANRPLQSQVYDTYCTLLLYLRAVCTAPYRPLQPQV